LNPEEAEQTRVPFLPSATLQRGHEDQGSVQGRLRKICNAQEDHRITLVRAQVSVPQIAQSSIDFLARFDMTMSNRASHTKLFSELSERHEPASRDFTATLVDPPFL
jgi:hypothetical protein